MIVARQHTFSKEGYGSLELELGVPVKQVFSGSVPESKWIASGLIEEDQEVVKDRYIFEYQAVQYSYTVKDNALVRGPFQLFINDRLERVSKAKTDLGIHVLQGNFTIADAVGYTRIRIVDSTGKQVFVLETEVFPQKMDYRSDHAAMLADISDIVHNLTYEALKDTYRYSRAKISGHTTAEEWWSILDKLFEDLLKNLTVITRQPKHEIRTAEKVIPVDRIKRTSKKNLDWLRKNTRYTSSADQGFQIGEGRSSSHALSSRKYVTYDTYENRFIAWAIKRILDRLRIYKKHILDLPGVNRYPERIKRIIHYQGRLQSILHSSPFDEVGVFEKRAHFSTSLTRGAGYRDFMVIHLLLSRGLELWEKNDLFRVDQKNISTLYEYWCFLKLVQLLKEKVGSQLDLRDLIKVRAGKINVNLSKGNPSKVKFTDRMSGLTAILYFNKEFNDSEKVFTFKQKPDYTLEFSKPGLDQSFWYLFDAKYRFNESSLSGPTTYDAPDDSIGQMHRYRDAILHTKPTPGTYRRALKNLGGIILYPYPLSEEQFRSSKYFKSIAAVNIGALPFLPSKTSLVTEMIQELFKKRPEAHFEDFIEMDRSSYHESRERWSDWVTIGVFRKEHQQKRIQFFESTKLFHVPFVKNLHSKLFLSKHLLVCKAGSVEAVRCDVKEWEVMSSQQLKEKGATWPLSFDRYVVFHTTDHDLIRTPEPIAPRKFRYTTKEGLDRYLASNGTEKGLIYLSHANAARLYDTLRDARQQFSLGWGREENDPSLLEFTVGETIILSSGLYRDLHYRLNEREVHLNEVLGHL